MSAVLCHWPLKYLTSYRSTLLRCRLFYDSCSPYLLAWGRNAKIPLLMAVDLSGFVIICCLDCSVYSVLKDLCVVGLHQGSPPPFYMTTFSASPANLTALLPQSQGSSCYVCRQILAHSPLCLLKHTDIHDFAHCPDIMTSV